MKPCISGFRASVLVASFLLSLSTTAGAIEPIPEETGWSGLLLFGAGLTDVKTNTVVGNGIIDVGKSTISSIFDGPQSDDTVHPLVGVELKYTLPGRNQS